MSKVNDERLVRDAKSGGLNGGGQREESGMKTLGVCKSKRIRVSGDLFQHWKDSHTL